MRSTIRNPYHSLLYEELIDVVTIHEIAFWLLGLDKVLHMSL